MLFFSSFAFFSGMDNVKSSGKWLEFTEFISFEENDNRNLKGPKKMESKKIKQHFASDHKENKQCIELWSLQIRHKKSACPFLVEHTKQSPPAQCYQAPSLQLWTMACIFGWWGVFHPSNRTKPYGLHEFRQYFTFVQRIPKFGMLFSSLHLPTNVLFVWIVLVSHIEELM